MRRNLRANAIAPGRVNINLRANSQRIAGAQDEYDKTISQWKDIEAAVKDGYVTNLRIAEPGEIVRVALFLASDEAKFLNGSVVTADGGWTSY
jgi:NAD(P)-dependent dehydrogenase (short-subunit alcohol dehydrogenase family)